LALYVASYNIEAAKTASIRVVVPLAILFGLWLQSNLARYLGAIWFVGAMASAVWPLVSNDKLVWGFAPVWALALSVLCLALSGILLFSKQFADEFSRQRETQPKYKKVLIRLTVAVLIVLAIIATLNDVYNLFLAS
jgi:hypothetical protein